MWRALSTLGEKGITFIQNVGETTPAAQRHTPGDLNPQ